MFATLGAWFRAGPAVADGAVTWLTEQREWQIIGIIALYVVALLVVALLAQQRLIIFLTGYGDIPMSVWAIKAGAVDFLTKPCHD